MHGITLAIMVSAGVDHRLLLLAGGSISLPHQTMIEAHIALLVLNLLTLGSLVLWLHMRFDDTDQCRNFP